MRTFDITLTEAGTKVLGPPLRGRPDYETLAAFQPPQSYVRIPLCRKKVESIDGIRILQPGVLVAVEYRWTCASAGKLPDMLRKTRRSYGMGGAVPLPEEGRATTKLALYDDGWRIASPN